MPGLWLERSASATVKGEGVQFRPRIAALPFSTGTPAAGLTLPLVDAGAGAEADFTRLGTAARGAFVLIETEELHDIDGLFKEYNEAVGIERRAFAAGATGLVYMSSRPNDLLARHNASTGLATTHPMMMMERDAAARALRLLRAGKRLTLTAMLDVQSGPDRYGFHPSLPGLRDLYNQNALAVVANVGRVAPGRGAAGELTDNVAEMQVRYVPGGYLAIPWAVPVADGSEPQQVLALPHGVTLAAPGAAM